MTTINFTRKINIYDPAALPSWLSGKSLLTWYSLPGTNITAAMADMTDGVDYYFSKLGIVAFSGTAFNPNTNEIIHLGGGHSDYSGNDVYKLALGVTSPSWTRLKATTKVNQIPWSPSPTTQGVSHYSDGRPASRHTYSHIHYIGARNRVFLFGCAAAAGNVSTNHAFVDAFNLSTNDYDAKDTWAVPAATDFKNTGNPSVKDADENVYKFINTTGVLLKWTQATAAWSTLYTDANQNETQLAYDPVRNRVLRISRDSRCYYDLNTGATKTSFSFSGPAAGSVTPNGTFIWCPDRGKFIHMPWKQNSVVVEIDPVSFSVSTLAVGGTPPPYRDNGYSEFHSRFFYAPALKCVMLMTLADDNVYYFRVG